VLVMDEPTNDLDMETLDLLETILGDYAGTLLVVSHDREFLNNVVSSTLVFEGDGRIKEYAGGYDDWLAQRSLPTANVPVVSKTEAKPDPRTDAKSDAKPQQRSRRLSYKEQRELEALPAKIESLEAELAELHSLTADAAFYRKPQPEIVAVKARLGAIESEVAAAYGRWEELESSTATGSSQK
jgi:ATP-binding cassette subfamily F protein uup